MPIKPENYALYPGGSPTSLEWLELRAGILVRAKNNCERCGVENHCFVLRSNDGATFYREHEWGAGAGDLRCAETGALLCRDMPWTDFDAGDKKTVKIVLTIAHLDQDPTNNDHSNLAALCQRCHNLHDQPYRQANAAKTRHAHKAIADLFEMTERQA